MWKDTLGIREDKSSWKENIGEAKQWVCLEQYSELRTAFAALEILFVFFFFFQMKSQISEIDF